VFNDEELLALLSQKVNEACGFNETEISLKNLKKSNNFETVIIV
jgi:hypothetical protein